MTSKGSCAGLLLDFGHHWEIEQGAAWVACTRNGSFTHVIAAHTLDDLRAKIARRRPMSTRARTTPPRRIPGARPAEPTPPGGAQLVR